MLFSVVAHLKAALARSASLVTKCKISLFKKSQRDGGLKLLLGAQFKQLAAKLLMH